MVALQLGGVMEGLLQVFPSMILRMILGDSFQVQDVYATNSF